MANFSKKIRNEKNLTVAIVERLEFRTGSFEPGQPTPLYSTLLEDDSESEVEDLLYIPK